MVLATKNMSLIIILFDLLCASSFVNIVQQCKSVQTVQSLRSTLQFVNLPASPVKFCLTKPIGCLDKVSEYPVDWHDPL